MEIPSDIITQILYRLPSKSVARFRCVSKEWLSLLTDPKFIKTHSKTHNRTHLIFSDSDIPSYYYYESDTYSFDGDCNSYLYSYPLSHDHYDDPFIISKENRLPIELDASMTFNGSCDGLVLVSAGNGCGFDTLVLLNQTTMEFVQLPEPNYYPETSNEESFESTCSRHGVGYDSVTDDYKVISLTYSHHDIDYETIRTTTCYLYSLRSNTWRQLNIDSLYYFNNSPAVYVNGFLYWVAKKSDHDSWAIVAFSLADECFSEVPSPGSCNDREIMPNWKSKLVVLDGKLAMYTNDDKFTLWLMNEYGVKKSWTKIPLGIFDDKFLGFERPVIFYDNGKIRVASLGQMLIHDFEKTTLSENAYVWCGRFRVFGSYVESLVPIPKRKDTTDSSQDTTDTSNAGEVDLPKNLDPIYHHFCNKSLRFLKILDDKKANLRNKERGKRKVKVKNKRKKFKKSIVAVEEYGLINDDVSLGDSSRNEEGGKDFENLKMLGIVTFQDFLDDIYQCMCIITM